MDPHGLGFPRMKDGEAAIPPDWKRVTACNKDVAAALARLSDIVCGVRARLDDWPSNKDEMAQEEYAESLSLDLLEVQSELNEAAGRNILGEKP